MKRLLATAGLFCLLVVSAPGRAESLLARVTVYWPGEGGHRACSNGARLRSGHCAVDPKHIPYGSKVYFPDGPCVAVDTGPAVINRKAARLSGRNARQRNALVIDRFFETKEQALAWERAHPHFMTVRIVSGRSIAPPQGRPTAVVEMKPTPGAHLPPPNSAQPVATTTPLPCALHEGFSTARIALKNPGWSLPVVPPSYHRRRFAADGNDETSAPPPPCRALPAKEARPV